MNRRWIIKYRQVFSSQNHLFLTLKRNLRRREPESKFKNRWESLYCSRHPVSCTLSQMHDRSVGFTHHRVQRWHKELLGEDKAIGSSSSATNYDTHPSANRSSHSAIFLPSITVDPECLAAEFEVFTNILGCYKESCKSVREACEFAYRKRLLFPAV